MRAVAGEADIAARAPDFGAEPFSGPFHHHAAKVTARRARQDRVSEMAGDVLDVAGIHRGAFDLHDRALRIGGRGGHIDVFEYVGAAKRLELDSFHRQRS